MPCVAVIARTDPNEQESVALLPELEQQARVTTRSIPRSHPSFPA